MRGLKSTVRAEAPIIAANVSAEREGSIISFPFIFNSFCSTFLPPSVAFFLPLFLPMIDDWELLPKEMRSDEVNASLNVTTLRTFNEGIVCEILSRRLSVAYVENRGNRSNAME